MIVVFEEIWPNIRIVTLLHCYIVTCYVKDFPLLTLAHSAKNITVKNVPCASRSIT